MQPDIQNPSNRTSIGCKPRIRLFADVQLQLDPEFAPAQQCHQQQILQYLLTQQN